MTTEEQKPKRLTVDDPIDASTLASFSSLEAAKYDVALQLLEIEQDKVKLLAAAHRIDEQRQRTFERVLMERGLPPTSRVEVDGKTGKIKVLAPVGSGVPAESTEPHSVPASATEPTSPSAS